jgi:predicted dehydrogenase
MNVGVIGLGYWGPNIVRNFLIHPEVEKVYCCDLDIDRFKKLKNSYYSIEFKEQVTDLLCDTSIDAVAIVTPVETHYSLAKQAMLNGKHVLVEKPMTQTVHQAIELHELSEKLNKVLMVDHTFLYAEPVILLKELFQSGELGDLYYYDSVRINLGLFQREANVIWDLAPHDFSIMQYILNIKPISLLAMGSDHLGKGFEDIAYVHVDFGNNLIAHFHLNWLSPVKVRKLMISGTKKMAVYDDLENAEKIKIYDKGIQVKNSEQLNQIMVNYRTGSIYSPNINNSEALSGVINNFINSVKGSEKPKSNSITGIEVMKLLEATHQSLSGNGKIINL